MSTHLSWPVWTDSSLTAPATKILVFKTNILSRKEVKRLGLVLHKLAGVCRWNVDLMDIDKVLRIETEGLQAQEIIDVLTEAGYFCEELPD